MAIDIVHSRLTFTESAFAATASRFGVLAARLLKNMRNRRDIRRLADLDAAMLKDIGLAPGDVAAALASPLSEDPSQHLARLAAGRFYHQVY